MILSKVGEAFLGNPTREFPGQYIHLKKRDGISLDMRLDAIEVNDNQSTVGLVGGGGEGEYSEGVSCVLYNAYFIIS